MDSLRGSRPKGSKEIGISGAQGAQKAREGEGKEPNTSPVLPQAHPNVHSLPIQTPATWRGWAGIEALPMDNYFAYSSFV